MARKQHNIELPPEFNAPAQLILYTRYGDPRKTGWHNKWITTWQIQDVFPWFPEKAIDIHKHFRPILLQALEQLAVFDLHNEIKTFDGCYKVRPAKGNNSVLSVHAWGAAIDLNAVENPHGSLGKWSTAFIDRLTDNNIFCGQKWDGRKDPMHFAMVNG